MTEKEKQPQGFLNNAIVGLLILFTIPAILVFGGFYLIAMQGRVPGGETTSCVREISEGLSIEIESYKYVAGLSPYETQTINRLQSTGTETIFDDTVQAPLGISCEDNILVYDTSNLIIYTQKSIAITNNSGESWTIQNICDDPRPTTSRCDDDPLNIVNVDFVTRQAGQITVRETLVDEYGQPMSENGQPIIVDEYVLQTDDGGTTWSLQSLP